MISLVGIAFADDDCLLGPSPVSSGAWQAYSLVLPYQDLKLAYNHLWAYCCKNGLFPKDRNNCGDNAPKDVYLESPFLFDHLVDVWIRHFDPLSIYSGQTVDSWAKEWYDLFSLSEDKSITPQFVKAQYTKYWTLTFKPLFQDQTWNISSYLPLYWTTGFSLRDKYYNLCFSLKLWYENVLQWNSAKRPIQIKDQYDPDSYYSKCMDLVDKKVSVERVYAQTTMLERSTNTLDKSIETFTMTNFVKDRLWSLYDKLKSVVDLFWKIVAQAPLSKRCAK